jgi:hypothetical protein
MDPLWCPEERFALPTLSSHLRNKLERAVVEARDAAEAGARAALEALGVHSHEPYGHMSAEERRLRNHLRARARQLGDRQERSGALAMDHLVNECAYEHWHRMLFARFLAENDLLIEPEMEVPISLEEAEELAKEEGKDVWEFASTCAERMLPQIFRAEDPLLQVELAPEHLLKLEELLGTLPTDVFMATDALGWVYQFWQTKKKDEVNQLAVKIGADEISAVTQLFTEPYMVEFLIHNTLGAWWAGKQADRYQHSAVSEEDCRRLVGFPGLSWDYLRFVRGENGEGGPWRPAAGTFDGWPETAAEIKVLDPCCGSGHFLVLALHHLVPIRMAEEGSTARDAVDAVLRDNLHGLEIDERCCQIAAFALACAAWTYPSSGGYRPLPDLHIACTGIGPQSTQEQWVKLAEDSGIPIPDGQHEMIRNGLLGLHRLFSQAPTLGSLLDPSELSAEVISASYETIQPYLTAILRAEKADEEVRERAIAAAGMAKAASLLAIDYSLIITNVPYLIRTKHDKVLKAFADKHYRSAKQDLATVCLARLRSLRAKGGAVAVVSPQNWLFLDRYSEFRKGLLARDTWAAVARLGPGAFDTISGAVVNVGMFVLVADAPLESQSFCAIDAAPGAGSLGKAGLLATAAVLQVSQVAQQHHPDHRVLLDTVQSESWLAHYASVYHGISTTDYCRFGRNWWELSPRLLGREWIARQSSFKNTGDFVGKECCLFWGDQGAKIKELRSEGATVVITGLDAWGKWGVAVSQMGQLPATLYLGTSFDDNLGVIVPGDVRNLPAIWAFCSSDEYRSRIRLMDQSIKVAYPTLLKVPFELDNWQKAAAEKYPDGLPEPESDDPTQWLFHGYPYEAEEDAMLQVAVARLLGYRWPAELDTEMRLSKRARALAERCGELAEYVDGDGTVCIPSVRGEEPAADRLLALLAAAGIDQGTVRECTGGSGLDEWLRNGFFQEHCKLFHERPFVWHIWDGRKRDGFHALVNYHKLAEGNGKGRQLLESLTYSYLGDWITRQQSGVKAGEGGAEDRLAAALELQRRLIAILEGEPPFDLFVRWKPLHQQAIGWEPDINDGVRLNIRPFLASDLPNGRKGAGILRYKPNTKWKKDRGKEPVRPKEEYPWFWGWDEETVDFAGNAEFDGNRWNDCHYTNDFRRKAREAARGGDKS